MIIVSIYWQQIADWIRCHHDGHQFTVWINVLLKSCVEILTFISYHHSFSFCLTLNIASSLFFSCYDCLSSFTRVVEGMSLGNDIPISRVGCNISLKVKTHTHPTSRYTLRNVVREWWGTVLLTKKRFSVPSQANNNKPGAGFQWAFSLKWDTGTRITNISLVLSSGPGPWKNYSKYLPCFIWNPGIG